MMADLKTHLKRIQKRHADQKIEQVARILCEKNITKHCAGLDRAIIEGHVDLNWHDFKCEAKAVIKYFQSEK